MKTICAKCAWHQRYDGRQEPRDRCFAPWPKNVNKVTGKLEPVFMNCETQNNGHCTHFKEKWYRRLWKSIFTPEIS